MISAKEAAKKTIESRDQKDQIFQEVLSFITVIIEPQIINASNNGESKIELAFENGSRTIFINKLIKLLKNSGYNAEYNFITKKFIIQWYE